MGTTCLGMARNGPITGCGSVWLEHWLWEPGIESSNLSTPTMKNHKYIYAYEVCGQYLADYGEVQWGMNCVNENFLAEYIEGGAILLTGINVWEDSGLGMMDCPRNWTWL